MSNLIDTYKSTCKACFHNHNSGICVQTEWKHINAMLSPTNMNDFGNMWNNTKEFNLQYWDACGCKFYVPSDNLEFMEWIYEHSSK